MRPHAKSYESVWEFERRVAEFAASKYAVATDSCTSAIFLCCKYLGVRKVTLPANTYISVPFAVIHAGGTVAFEDFHWLGSYRLEPYDIVDSALRFHIGMYQGGLHCLSFQARKILPIGRGGMVLTDDAEAAAWLRKARANGRNPEIAYGDDQIGSIGWNMAMTPEQASRGIQLLENVQIDHPDQQPVYPDLRRMPVFGMAA